MGELFVKRVGHGPRVVLLHGSVLASQLCWIRQLPLADRFALEMVDRAGYGRSQRRSGCELRQSVRACPLTSTGVSGDCY